MFAHQIMTDLIRLRETTPEWSKVLEIPDKDVKNAKIMFDNAIHEIPKAQKFHIGNIFDYSNLRNSLTSETRKGLRFPYPIMYFDATISYPDTKLAITKIAFLVQRKTELNHTVYTFKYYANFGMWNPETFVILYDSVNNSWLPYGVDRGLTTECIKQNGQISLDIVHIVLALLNCKNISTETIAPPKALNKKRRKEGKVGIFSYHVLNVVLPQKKRGYHEATTPLSHNRVHLCRGHFKEYTPEHPLFGKLTGCYWWQPHVRGRNESGIVAKEYNIKKEE